MLGPAPCRLHKWYFCEPWERQLLSFCWSDDTRIRLSLSLEPLSQSSALVLRYRLMPADASINAGLEDRNVALYARHTSVLQFLTESKF